MPLSRKTAVVQFDLPSAQTAVSLPLATERTFNVILLIDGKTYPALNFYSPINDQQWREFKERLAACNSNHDDSGDLAARAIKALAAKLYASLLALAPTVPEWRAFLESSGVPRRLVIQTTRPELHLLPWAAMFDTNGRLLAAGDLSVVQSWQDFSTVSTTTGSHLRLLKVLGADTSRATAEALKNLPPEIEIADALVAFRSGREVEDIDILHLEQHGDVALGLVGGVRSATLARTFQSAKMALLWSCHSGATDSWGVSPALSLHRDGAGLVLSFLVELHNLDAKSIANDFYADVFGAAASRDPESALVRIRAARVKKEFDYANWASMTVYLRAPLDLSALPLNGPRVPASGWTKPGDATVVAGTPAIAEKVGTLQPGALNKLELGSEPMDILSRDGFKDWRGNVIRLDGSHNPVSDDVIAELNLPVDQAPATDASDRLVWFFAQIARYGSPLIVWTNAQPDHMDFLYTIKPSSTLTFLLLYRTAGQDELPAAKPIAELIARNNMTEAVTQAGVVLSSPGMSDGELSASYFAFVRSKQPAEGDAYIARAEECIRRLSNPAERLLLSGNFISRIPRVPALEPEQMKDLIAGWPDVQPKAELTKIERQRYEEEWYRKAMNAPGGDATRRDAGRAKHQLGYLLQKQGQIGAAETLYRLALEDLEHSTKHGIRWHAALGAVLRDWADLLSRDSARLAEARALLARAMAVHSFHGRKQEIAYSLITAAQIALTGYRHNEAIDHAVNSANIFEVFKNWDGWSKAMGVLFNSLAETRETHRMIALADLATEKLEGANLSANKLATQQHRFAYQRARAHWIAGSLSEAREEVDALLFEKSFWDDADDEVRFELFRLHRFLGGGSNPKMAALEEGAYWIGRRWDE
jgi:hypothetical protein